MKVFSNLKFFISGWITSTKSAPNQGWDHGETGLGPDCSASQQWSPGCILILNLCFGKMIANCKIVKGFKSDRVWCFCIWCFWNDSPISKHRIYKHYLCSLLIN